MTSTPLREPPDEPDGRNETSHRRWKTSARIDAINEAHAASSLAKQLATRRWATLHSDLGPQQPTSPAPALQAHAAPDDSDASLVQDDRVPAWLASLIVHMAIVLLLALWGFTRGAGQGTTSLTVRWYATDNPADHIEVVETESPLQQDAPQAIENPADAIRDLADKVLRTEVEVPNPLDNQEQSEVSTLLDQLTERGAVHRMNQRIAGGELGDRSEGGRAAAVAAGDTSAAAEDALESALRWIAEHQHNDGGWSFRLDDPLGPCQGKCDDERKNPDDAPIPRTAATGLALLAFMGAGSTHFEGPYAQEVQRGLYYLRSQARDSSLGIDLQNGSMYGHGIATLALAEAYVLTGDKDLRELVEGTTFFCSGAQHPSGGWGYRPKGPPDITLTAWQIIAIKTAEEQGVRVPTNVIPAAKEYLETLASSGGSQFGYRSPEPTLTTSAIGLLLRLYFGWSPSQTSLREGLNRLVAAGPSKTNVYYNYYASLALHHARHQGRLDFARGLQDYLIATQSREGHERGSWHFADRYGSVGGRLYTTALCCLILETPYRYVPMHGERDFEL